MIVEFSGSPASGKTAIAFELYDEGYYPFRLSSKSRWQRVVTLSVVLSFEFIKDFVSGFFVLKKQVSDLKLMRLLILSAQGAMTHTLAKRKDIYIKDQGFFQFGDWVKEGREKDVDYLALTISSIKAQPDFVVFFDLPAELIASRMKGRGDYGTWLTRALKRGYESVVNRLESQYKILNVKYELCSKLNIPYIIIEIDSDASIQEVKYSSDCGRTALDFKQIKNLENKIVNAWNSKK